MNRPHAVFTLIRIARVLMVAFILFTTIMFSLDVDGFSTEDSFNSFILVAVLLVSWRSPLLCGLLALACAAFPVRWRLQGIAHFAMLVLPLIVVGVLFVASHFVRRKPASGPRP